MVAVKDYLSRGTTEDALLAAMVDLINEMRDAAASGSSFRRLADPYMVTCAPTAGKTDVDADDLRAKGVTSFVITNPNPFWVRLRGSYLDPGFRAVTPTMGWMFPPGLHAVYATQYPDFMSAMAVEAVGFPIKDSQGNALYPNAVIEVAYGTGA